MTDLINTIRQRGHWQVTIRPTMFVEHRIANISDLWPIVSKSAVPLWGWEFPAILPAEHLRRDVDWVGQEITTDHHLELWRFYQSGQFFDIFGIWDDWRDRSSYRQPFPGWQPGARLGILYLAKTYAAIFEFAARIALSAAGEERMRIEVVLRGLSERVLFTDSGYRTPLRHYQAKLDEWPYEIEVDRAELATQPRELALTPARELCARFGFNIGNDMIRELQEDER